MDFLLRIFLIYCFIWCWWDGQLHQWHCCRQGPLQPCKTGFLPLAASEVGSTAFTLPDSPPTPYWILATDYDDSALVYSCTHFVMLHAEFAWIMSRQPTLAEGTTEELFRRSGRGQTAQHQPGPSWLQWHEAVSGSAYCLFTAQCQCNKVI